MEGMPTWPQLYDGLFWPLVRLIGFISLGLFVGNLIESLKWTKHVAVVAAPLAKRARLKDIAGASFSMAFFSGVAANTMLSEAFNKGEISDRELVLSNLFNSLPTYMLHLPTIFFIASPFIKGAAGVYVALCALAALLRTAVIVVCGHFFLPPIPEGCVPCRLDEVEESKATALQKTWKRFKKRLPKILYFTVPIYICFFLLKHWGWFEVMKLWLADNVSFISWLPPEALTIATLQIVDIMAGLAAAGALIQDSGLDPAIVVLALITGNVLSSPMRAVRHQLPYYAGIYRPRMALRLIIFNQTLRALSLILVGAIYGVLVLR